jgi:hypothetical protein
MLFELFDYRASVSRVAFGRKCDTGEIYYCATKTQGADLYESQAASVPRLAQIGTTLLQTVRRRSFETLVCRLFRDKVSSPPSWHCLGPLHMPLEAQRCRHCAVVVPIVALGGFIPTGAGQQRPQPQKPDLTFR